jgi:hypothetical protein
MKDHACPYFITKTNHLFFPSCFSSFIFISFFVLWHHSVSLFNCDCASFYNKVKSFHNWCRPLSFISFFFLLVCFIIFFICFIFSLLFRVPYVPSLFADRRGGKVLWNRASYGEREGDAWSVTKKKWWNCYLFIPPVYKSNE